MSYLATVLSRYGSRLKQVLAAAVIASVETALFASPTQAAAIEATWNSAAQAVGNWEDGNWIYSAPTAQTFPNNNGNAFNVKIDDDEAIISKVTITTDIIVDNIFIGGGGLLGGDTLRVASVLNVEQKIQGNHFATIEVPSGGALFANNISSPPVTALILDVEGTFQARSYNNPPSMFDLHGGFIKRGSGLLDIFETAYITDSSVIVENGTVSILGRAEMIQTLLDISETSTVLISDAAVMGDLVFEKSILRIRIEGTDKIGFLSVGGTIDLRSSLNFTQLDFLVSGFTPRPGDIFTFLDAGEILIDVDTLRDFTVGGTPGKAYRVVPGLAGFGSVIRS